MPTVGAEGARAQNVSHKVRHEFGGDVVSGYADPFVVLAWGRLRVAHAGDDAV